MKLDFKNHPAAQDMIKIIVRDKGLETSEAIKFSISDKMYKKIVNAGWASMALDLWGHDDPERTWDEMESPCIEVEMEEDKMRLVESIVKKEKVDIETAVSYFLIFTMDSLGYHI